MVRTPLSNAGGVGSVPVWETKIPHVTWPKSQNIQLKQYCNKFSKDFKQMVHVKKKKKEILKNNKMR